MREVVVGVGVGAIAGGGWCGFRGLRLGDGGGVGGGCLAFRFVWYIELALEMLRWCTSERVDDDAEGRV